MHKEQPKTAAYDRRNKFELKKAKTKRWARARHGVKTESPEGPYYRWFVDREERDRVFALLRRPDHPESRYNSKVARNEYNEIVPCNRGLYRYSP